MGALSAPRTNLSNKGPIAGSFGLKAAVSQTFWNGALCAFNSAGWLVPAAATAGLRVAGVCDLGNLLSKVTTGSNGDTELKVILGVFPFANGTSTDALTQADVGNDVYVLDDQTVGRLPGAGRPVAGQLIKFENGLPYVSVGGPYLAHVEGDEGGSAGTAHQGVGSVQLLSTPGAIDVVTELTLLTVDGTDAATMADGLFLGQKKYVALLAGANTPNCTNTPATPRGHATVTAIGAAGDCVAYEWTATGWVIIAANGVTVT